MAQSIRRRLLPALVLMLLAGFLVPPAVNLNSSRRQVARALEAGLGRPVAVGAVRLKLLPVPGLVAENVVVGEDPAFGAENFARMAELRGNLRWRSLWTGRLSFSSLVFVEPSVNLAGSGDGRWNVAALFAPLRAGAARGPLPYLEFQDGRINFKEGDVKSVFFFSDVDAAVYQESGRLRLRFRGVPSRTDRTLTGAGEVRAEGEFGPKLASPLRLRLDLVNAYLGDLLALASGSDHGIHGSLGLTAEVAGRPEALRLQGRLEVGDLHRWDLLPPESSAALELAFSGTADVPGRRLELAEVRSARGTMLASGWIQDFLPRPTWDFQVRFAGADARRLFAAVHHFSPRLSPTLRVEGRLEGVVRFTRQPAEIGTRNPELGTAEGKLLVRNLSFQGQRLPTISVPLARLDFTSTQVRLAPVNLRMGTSMLTLGLAWDWTSPAGGARRIEVTASGRNLALRSLAPLAANLGWPGLPEEGRLSLNTRLELERDLPPRITGWATVTRLRLAPSWLSDPVVVHTARVDFTGDQVKAGRLVVAVGNSIVTGTVRAPLASTSAGRWLRRTGAPRRPAGAGAGFAAAVAAKGASLDVAGQRPGAGLGRNPVFLAELRVDETGTASLARLFSSAKQVSRPPPDSRPWAPDFLSRLGAEGIVEVGRFRLRGLLLENLRAAFSVSARQIVLRDARATLAGGGLSGQMRLNFSRPTPEYDARARLAAVPLEALAPDLAAGAVSGTLELTALGLSAAEINDSLRLRGRFSGHDLALRSASLTQALKHAALRSLAAEVLVQNRRVRFSRLSLKAEGEDLEGVGWVGFDRSLDLDFRGSGFRLLGTLAAPRRMDTAEIARARTR